MSWRKPLGQGGMGSVFRAYERKHDRRVVIKVLRPESLLLFGADRFKTEVELAARLSHPHILGLIDSGDADGYLYYVMPYVGGETLRTRLNRLGKLEVGEATVLLRDLADALAHAHGAGVIHRDIKPENVLCVGGHAFPDGLRNRPAPERDGAPHRGRCRARNAGLHVSRATERRLLRSPHRHLFVRARGPRDAAGQARRHGDFDESSRRSAFLVSLISSCLDTIPRGGPRRRTRW
jgi:hypothetical protein